MQANLLASIDFTDRGAPKCLKKQPCTNKDFYEMWSPCDENGKVSDTVAYKNSFEA